MKYNALVYSSDPKEDKRWVVILVGEYPSIRLRYLDDLHPRATEYEKEWYSVMQLTLVSLGHNKEIV